MKSIPTHLNVPELCGLIFIILLNSMSLITTGTVLLYTVAGAVFHRRKTVNSELRLKNENDSFFRVLQCTQDH